MELKKSYNADLERQRVPAFLLGLVCVLSFFLISLEYTSRSTTADTVDDVIEDMSQDVEIMPLIRQKDMMSTVLSQRRPAITERINAVEDVGNEAVADIRPDKGDHDAQQNTGEGAVEGDATTTETQQVATALSPVAVDDNDNPLNFHVVEKLPEFPGGITEFMKWLTKTLKYPAQAQRQKVQGTVVVSFIINKDGSVTGLSVVKSVSQELDREALRVLRMMPKWKPGEDHGKPCRTYFRIPIVFKL